MIRTTLDCTAASAIPLAEYTMDIDTRASFRVGAPTLLVEPVDTIPHTYFTEWWDLDFRAAIRRILCAEGVMILGFDAVMRVARGRNKSTSSRRTVLVTSDVSISGQYRSWERATSRIRFLLASKGRDDIGVEIIDTRAATGVECSPIENLDLVTAWEASVSILLREIDQHQWLCIDVVYRNFGQRELQQIPTICITATDAAEASWWDKTIPRLTNLLPKAFAINLFEMPAIKMEVDNPDRGDSVTEEDWPELYTDMSCYGDELDIGVSVGLSGSDLSATVGALLQLGTPDGKKIACGLTNYHVIAAQVTPECPVGSFLQPSHRICQDESVRMMSPSDKDHERLTRWKELQAQALTRSLQKSELHGLPSKRVVATRKACLDDLEVLKGSPSRYLGSIYAASGYRTSSNPLYTTEQTKKWSGVLDTTFEDKSLARLIEGGVLQWGLNWALIRLNTRLLSLTMPISVSDRKVFAPATRPLENYCNILPNRMYNVAKRGRTSGWTTGKINKIGSLLNLQHDSAVVPVDLRNRFNKILLAYGIVSTKSNDDFISSGDSGSIVILNEPGPTATIVGLAFASNTATGISYMISMNLIIDDIERVTGLKVLLPKLAGFAAGDTPP